MRLRALIAALAVLAVGGASAQAPDPVTDSLADPLADPVTAPTLRVCADPDDLPFSNRAGEGVHNRIAALLASALGREVAYAWYPYGIGFLRQTLLRGRCDVALGDVRPHEGVALTRPYMQADYVLVAPAGRLPAGLIAVDDGRLAGLRVGVVTGSPPATHLAHAGWISHARPYRPILDRRHGAPAAQMIDDLLAGRTDAVALWRPRAVRVVETSGGTLALTALARPRRDPPLTYQVALAVRSGDVAWRALLNRVLDARQDEIAAILDAFGIAPAPRQP